jgi:GAF domain-containing protein
MSDPRPARDIGPVLAEFAQLMADDREPKSILERLGAYCTELLPVHGVGVLLRNEKGELEVATANTEKGSIVERLEAELREGPCTDSIASGEQIAVPDLELTREQYPRFTPAALEAGVRAIHGLPLTMRGQVVGSMDLIATDVLNLTAAEISTAQMLGDVTVSYLANSRAFAEQSQLAQQLQHALDSRIIIEQAKGKLSERLGVTVTEAFELLRRYARNNGLKLHDVAAATVRGDLNL